MVAIDDIISVGLKIIDKIVPDPAAKAEAQVKLLLAQQNGELEEMRTQLSAIIAESQSTDPWTSRARPSFLYVMYVMILFAFPMGVLSIFDPASAISLSTGVNQWLSGIPEELWTLFGIGYLGYTGGRTWEKIKITKKGST